MGRPAPLRKGLKILLREPALIFGEIAWRWCFGIACWAVIVFTLREYLSSLSVSPVDWLLWKTGFAPWMAVSLMSTLQGSAYKLLRITAILLPALVLLWIFAATLGRAATLKAMLPGSPSAISKLAFLAFLRAALLLAALVSIAGAFELLGRNLAGGNRVFPDAGHGLLGLAVLCAVIFEIWSGLNWLLSVAAVPATMEKGTTLDALGATLVRFEAYTGHFAWVGLVIGSIHLLVIAAFLAIGVVLLGAAYAGNGNSWVGLLALLLGYFLIADFLKIWRLAAFVALFSGGPEESVIGEGQALRIPPTGLESGMIAQVH